MSKTVACPVCGAPMDVPAYEGDGVYTRHEHLRDPFGKRHPLGKQEEDEE